MPAQLAHLSATQCVRCWCAVQVGPAFGTRSEAQQIPSETSDLAAAPQKAGHEFHIVTPAFSIIYSASHTPASVWAAS
jgi:hypothetical protein